MAKLDAVSFMIIATRVSQDCVDWMFSLRASCSFGCDCIYNWGIELLLNP